MTTPDLTQWVTLWLGIKIGRYTTEKRRQDTVEVKQIKAENAVISQKVQEKSKEKRLVELIETVVDAGRKNFSNIDHLHEELAVMQEEINVGPGCYRRDWCFAG